MDENSTDTLSPEACAGKIFELSDSKFAPGVALVSLVILLFSLIYQNVCKINSDAVYCQHLKGPRLI